METVSKNQITLLSKSHYSEVSNSKKHQEVHWYRNSKPVFVRRLVLFYLYLPETILTSTLPFLNTYILSLKYSWYSGSIILFLLKINPSFEANRILFEWGRNFRIKDSTPVVIHCTSPAPVLLTIVIFEVLMIEVRRTWETNQGFWCFGCQWSLRPWLLCLRWSKLIWRWVTLDYL